MIDHNSSIPLYVQLAGVLEKAIDNKEYKNGEKLPSESQLCKQFNVSRITVRQALSKLEQKQLVYSVHGKGTFVHESLFNQGLTKITSFEKTLEEKGLKGYTKVEKFSRAKVPEYIKHVFRSENITRLCLVGYGEDIPLVYYDSYLRDHIATEMHDIAKVWQKEGKAFSTWDIYPKISINSLRMEQKITAVLSDKTIADALNISKGTPVLRMETYAYSGVELVEYKIAYYRSDKYSFTIVRELDNHRPNDAF